MNDSCLDKRKLRLYVIKTVITAGDSIVYIINNFF